MMPFQILTLSGSFIFLIVVLRYVYKSKIKEAYALLWIAATLVTAVFAIFPEQLSSLASVLGIVTPAFALILCMLGSILLLLFQITIIISGHHERITRLLEEISLLKEEVISKEKELHEIRKKQSGAENEE